MDMLTAATQPRSPLRLSGLVWLILGLGVGLVPILAQPTLQDRVAGYLENSREALQAKEWEKAESDAREALWISLDQLGAISSALKQFDLAERAYTEATHASASGAESLLGLAILHLRTGRYDEAIANVQGLLEINPLLPSAHHVLGKIYFMQGKYGEAASSLRDSYRAKHSDPSVAYTLALTYLKLGDAKSAADVFADMLEQLGDSAGLRVLFGRAYREAGKLDQAEREFRAAIDLDPKAPRAHYYLALTLLRSKGRAGFEEARRELEAELDVDPNSHFASFFLGVVFNQESNYEKSLPYLRKAVQTVPDSPDGWLYLGTSLAQLGLEEEAVPALRKAVELTVDPTRNNYQISNGYFVLGRILQGRGAREEAAGLLKRAAKLKAEASRNEPSILDNVLPDPHAPAAASLAANSEPSAILDDAEPDPEAREILRNTAVYYRESAAHACQQLARLAIERQQFGRAEKYLERSIFWDSSLPGNRFNLAVARIKNADPAGAVEPLIEELGVRADQKDVQQLLANLALSLTEGGDEEAAGKAVDTLLRLNPAVPDLHLLKGDLAARKSQYEEALIEYEIALQKNPSIPEAHYRSGLSLIRLGKFEEAAQQFEAELRLNPRHAKAMYHKAFVLLSQGENEEALPLLEKVVRLEPDYGEAYYELGKAQLEKKQLLVGLANLETAAHLTPGAPHVFYQLYRGYQASGRTTEAESAFNRYRELKKAQEEANLAHRREGAARPPDD